MLEDIKSAHPSGFKESESDVGSTEEETVAMVVQSSRELKVHGHGQSRWAV